MPRVAGSLSLALLLVLSSCHANAAPPATREDRWLAAVDGLCGALESAQNPDDARAAYEDRSRSELRQIAAAARSVDGAAAGALQGALDRLESEFAGDPSPSRLESDLTVAIDAAVAALRVLGVESPGCA